MGRFGCAFFSQIPEENTIGPVWSGFESVLRCNTTPGHGKLRAQWYERVIGLKGAQFHFFRPF